MLKKGETNKCLNKQTIPIYPQNKPVFFFTKYSVSLKIYL